MELLQLLALVVTVLLSAPSNTYLLLSVIFWLKKSVKSTSWDRHKIDCHLCTHEIKTENVNFFHNFYVNVKKLQTCLIVFAVFANSNAGVVAQWESARFACVRPRVQSPATPKCLLQHSDVSDLIVSFQSMYNSLFYPYHFSFHVFSTNCHMHSS